MLTKLCCCSYLHVPDSWYTSHTTPMIMWAHTKHYGNSHKLKLLQASRFSVLRFKSLEEYKAPSCSPGPAILSPYFGRSHAERLFPPLPRLCKGQPASGAEEPSTIERKRPHSMNCRKFSRPISESPRCVFATSSLVLESLDLGLSWSLFACKFPSRQPSRRGPVTDDVSGHTPLGPLTPTSERTDETES